MLLTILQIAVVTGQDACPTAPWKVICQTHVVRTCKNFAVYAAQHPSSAHRCTCGHSDPENPTGLNSCNCLARAATQHTLFLQAWKQQVAAGLHNCSCQRRACETPGTRAQVLNAINASFLYDVACSLTGCNR